MNPNAPPQPRSGEGHLRRVGVEIDIDFTRGIFPHANPFPKDYALKVLDPDYAPNHADEGIDIAAHDRDGLVSAATVRAGQTSRAH